MAAATHRTSIKIYEDRDEEGGTVTYLPYDGESYSLPAIYDAQHFALDAELGVTVSSTNPVLGVQRSDLQRDSVQDDQVKVRVNGQDVLYNVVDFKPDGQAGATLELRRA